MTKKTAAEYTHGERKFADRVLALKAGEPNAYVYRKNIAVTENGDFVIGLTYNTALERYSCSAIEFDGIRHNNPKRWGKDGEPLDGDLSPLLLASVHEGVRVI